MASFVGGSLQRHPVAWLLGLVALLYAWNLTRVELSVTDEARSGMIVRDILAGHVLLPRTPDGYLAEKPPAYYGSCALLGSVFGVNEGTLRGISVLAALATLAATAWIVRLFGPPRAAALAVLALASNILFLTAAREAMVDMMLTLFLTVGFAGYYAGRLGRISPERATGICGLAFGLALLSKGPLGLVLPIAVCGGELLIETRGRLWRVRRIWAPAVGSVILAVAVSCLWYLPGFLMGKGEFLETCLLSENVRMPIGQAAGIGVSHLKSPYYYPLWQLWTVLPALPLLVALPAWLRDPAQRAPRRLLGSWTLFGFLLFEVVSNKRFYYLVPLQPAVAAMIGLAADAWAERKGSPRWSFLCTGLLVALAGIGCALVPVVPLHLSAKRWADIAAAILQERVWVLGFGIVTALVGVGMALAVRRGPPALLRASAALAILVVAVRIGLGDRFIAAVSNRSRPFVRDMALKLPDSAQPVIFPPIQGYSLDFYWPKAIPRDAAAALAAEYVLIGRPNLNQLPGTPVELGVWTYGAGDSAHDRERDVLLMRQAP